MKTRLCFLIAAATLSASPVLATDGDHKPAAADDRLAACSREGKGLKGEEREKFLAKCLKKGDGDAVRHAQAPAPESQQNKMKKCNTEAGRKELKGDERRAFMSACLKG